MANFYLSDNLLTFDVYNILKADINIEGHWTIILDIETNEMKIQKFAGFGGLTYVIDEEHEAQIPTAEQRSWFESHLSRRYGVDLPIKNIKVYPEMNDGWYQYVFERES